MRALGLLFLVVWLGPVGAWAQDFWVGHFEDDTEEVQVVAHGLSGAPKALFLWTDSLTDPVNHEGAALSWSVCDADRCLGFAGDRVQIAGSEGTVRERSRRVTHENAVHLINGPRADLVGWDAQTITFRWDGDVAHGRIHILAIGGVRTRARVVDWRLPGTTPTGRVEVTGVGFQPDVILSLSSDQSLASIPATQDGMSLKMSVATAADAQWTTGTATNVQGDSLVARWLLHDSMIAGGSMIAFPIYRGRLEAMTPDGFVVDFPVTTGVSGAVASLALSGVQAQVGGIAGPTAAGSVLQEFTGMRFQPQAMLFRSVQAPRTEDIEPLASLGLGMSDGIQSSATAFREAPLGSLSVARGLGMVHLGLYQGLMGGRAELRSFNPTGFTLGWEGHAGVPVELAWLALAAAEGPLPPDVDASLQFSRQPVDGVAQQLLEPVEVRVASDTGEALSGVPVRLALVGGGGAVTLSGTLEVQTVDGIARFSDLVVDGPATDLRLTAHLNEATWVESEPFSVQAPEPPVPGHYRVACGCDASTGSAALGMGTLLLLLWGRTRRRSPG